MLNNIKKSVELNRDKIIEIGEWIYKNPETGFKEFKTSAYVIERFKELELSFIEFGNIPGAKATIDTGREGPSVAVLGELDSIVCPEHPDSSKESGAAHACGHNVQVAAMLGAAIGILSSGIVDKLSGKLHFIAVPAEESIEIEFRKKLRQEGKIRYLGGKAELLSRGIFDDVDMAMLVHAKESGKKFIIGSTTNGCLIKSARFIGRAAHAGGAPHEGINALYAANLGLMAINAIRETFTEMECIRVHPIITKGGDTVNVIPDDVRIETFVRGKRIEDIANANKKVNRALAGGAMALGAKVVIEDIPGYFPMKADENFNKTARKVMEWLVGEDNIEFSEHSTVSTDLGDISTVMPVIHPYIGGVKGGLHSKDFRIVDPYDSYVLGAEFLACTAAELLSNDAAVARDIIKNYKPVFPSKDSYIEYADKLFACKTYPEDEFYKQFE
ncbi:MAG TPA: amidohydrolase [Clostridiaceae bacterium]|nr:amidohydrolase [Clostridiaceae bacterium]